MCVCARNTLCRSSSLFETHLQKYRVLSIPTQKKKREKKIISSEQTMSWNWSRTSWTNFCAVVKASLKSFFGVCAVVFGVDLGAVGMEAGVEDAASGREARM
jgi:hypothetical protein